MKATRCRCGRTWAWWTVRIGTVSVLTLLFFTIFTDFSKRCDVPSVQKEDSRLAPLPSGPLSHNLPQNVRDHVYFSAYDGTNAYENKGFTTGTNKRPPGKLLSSMLDKVRDEAVQYLNQQAQRTYTRPDCNDVRYRHLPTVGVEVEVLCRWGTSPEMDRVNLLLQEAAPQVLFHSHTPTVNATNINIIMPLSGRLEMFRLFLDSLKEAAVDSDLQLGLTVVYFNDGESEAAKTVLKENAASIPHLKTHFLLLHNQTFSRSLALKEGVKKSKVDAPVVFLCDVDVFFTASFLRRCLTTPVEKKQVFFPVPFSQYNPALLDPLEDDPTQPPIHDTLIHDNNGFWRIWGHGMVCLYRKDFNHIHGFDSTRLEWGGEDLKFLQRTTRRRYKAVRSLDYGLFHRYHPKDCSSVGKQQRKACLRVKAMHEASSLTLGLWYVKDQVDHSSLCSLVNQMNTHQRKERQAKRNSEKAEKNRRRSEAEGELEFWVDARSLRVALAVMTVICALLAFTLSCTCIILFG